MRRIWRWFPVGRQPIYSVSDYKFQNPHLTSAVQSRWKVSLKEKSSGEFSALLPLPASDPMELGVWLQIVLKKIIKRVNSSPSRTPGTAWDRDYFEISSKQWLWLPLEGRDPKSDPIIIIFSIIESFIVSQETTFSRPGLEKEVGKSHYSLPDICANQR